MNNYCTNCGKKLAKGEYVCSSCSTPIVEEDILETNKSNLGTSTIKKVLLVILITAIVLFQFRDILFRLYILIFR